jgi:hypothetical protein
MKIVFVIILLSLSKTVCQGGLLIGKVFNRENKPLKAVVYLKTNYSIYSETTDEGGFSLELPDKHQADSIVIFAIGYSPKVVSVVSKSEESTFYLDRSFELSDLEISELANIPLNLITSDAIESIWSYVPNKTHMLSAFCRVISLQSKRVLSITETAISIFDEGYQRQPSAIKIQVNKIRQTNNNDTVKYRIPQSKNWDNQSFNPLYRAYETNYVRFIQKHGTVFNSSINFVRDKNFKILEINKINGEIFLKIGYYGDFGGHPVFSEYGYVTLNYNLKVLTSFERILFDTEHDYLLDHVSVLFAMFENRLYPSKIVVLAPKPGQLINNIKDSVYDFTTMWFDKVQLIKYFPAFSEEPKMKYLYPRKYPNDKEFWKMYLPTQLHSISKDVVDQFESVEEIDRQFEKNGEGD